MGCCRSSYEKLQPADELLELASVEVVNSDCGEFIDVVARGHGYTVAFRKIERHHWGQRLGSGGTYYCDCGLSVRCTVEHQDGHSVTEWFSLESDTGKRLKFVSNTFIVRVEADPVPVKTER